MIFHSNILKYIAALLLFCAHGVCMAQQIQIKHERKHRGYIQDFYKNHLILRAYESTKFNNVRFFDGGTKLIYKPNEHNNLGIGATYKFISLNIGFHIPFADKDLDKYGHTRQLDLQTHIYSRRYIIDFYGQFYRGYYLANPEVRNTYTSDQPIKRPDMRSRDISLSVQYIFNNDRFSYNAPTYQNEIQKKSAGSFLAGCGIFHSHVQGDSTLVPDDMPATFFRGNQFTAADHIGAEINGGYGYTLVIHKYFFATAMLTGGAGIGYSSITTLNGTRTGNWGPQIDLGIRCAAGYNYKRYFLGVNYVRLQTLSASAYPGSWQQVNRGNFRVIGARRFQYRKQLIPDNNIIKEE